MDMPRVEKRQSKHVLSADEAERIEQARPNRLLERVYGQKEVGAIPKDGTG
ncbi:hypothetical protein [Trinickia dinghuensis]|uniref:hypothetical protein n=1 Tax=Trinickia dinghuensis TaxID=2291023 RepID=UPI0015F17E6C|nr:hypothetical protein [Trinickia dinghuensis]